MKKGDIVSCRFPFTDLTGSKRRPAMILYEGRYDVMVAFISSQLTSRQSEDIEIVPDSINRLKHVSLIKPTKIATIQKSLIAGRIGEVGSRKISEFNQSLIQILQLR